MVKNKSIDGLATHAAKSVEKKSAPRVSASDTQPAFGQKPKPTAKKPAPKKPAEKKPVLENPPDIDDSETLSSRRVISSSNEKEFSREDLIEDFTSPLSLFNFENDPKTASLRVEEPKKSRRRAKKNTKNIILPAEEEPINEPENELEESSKETASDETSEPEFIADPADEIKDNKEDPIDDRDEDMLDFKDNSKNSDEEIEEIKKSKKSTKKSKKPSKTKKIIKRILLLLVVVIIGFIIWAVLWGNDIIANITGGQGNVADFFSFITETYDPLKTDANGRTNILAFGTSGYNMDGEEGDGTHDGAQLTDSIMVISLDQTTGDIAMLSLPRDLKVSATCTATGKINELYWCANQNGDNEAAGAEALIAEVESILGIEFQYYAHLNWGSLISIVDTLGGIEVTLDEDILDYNWTGAVYEAGVTYTLNGEEALGLARARHGTTGGDFSRGASQQKILIGIKNKLLEKDFSVSELISLASTLGDNLRTNLSISEMKTAAHLLSEFDFDSMRSLSLYPDYITTGTINGISYVYPTSGVGNYYQIRTYVAKQFSSDPRDYEDSTILVLNATDTYGLAGNEKIALETEGYSNIDIDNTPEGDYPSGTALYYLSDTASGTKTLLEEYYGVTAGTLDDLPESLRLYAEDYDFIIILNATATTATN